MTTTHWIERTSLNYRTHLGLRKGHGLHLKLNRTSCLASICATSDEAGQGQHKFSGLLVRICYPLWEHSGPKPGILRLADYRTNFANQWRGFARTLPGHCAGIFLVLAFAKDDAQTRAVFGSLQIGMPHDIRQREAFGLRPQLEMVAGYSKSRQLDKTSWMSFVTIREVGPYPMKLVVFLADLNLEAPWSTDETAPFRHWKPKTSQALSALGMC